MLWTEIQHSWDVIWPNVFVKIIFISLVILMQFSNHRWAFGCRASVTMCHWLRLWSQRISHIPSSPRGVLTPWWASSISCVTDFCIGLFYHSFCYVLLVLCEKNAQGKKEWLNEESFVVLMLFPGNSESELLGGDPWVAALQQEHLKLLHLH